MECMKSLSKFKKAVHSLENKEPNVYPWSDQIEIDKMSSKKLKSRARSQNTSYLNIAAIINKKNKNKNKSELNSDNSSNLSITSKNYLMNNISLSSLKEKGDRSSINSMLSQKNNMNLEIKSTIRHSNDSANKIQNKYNQELKQVNIENDYSDIKNIEKIDKNDKQEIFMLNYKNLTDLEKNSVINNVNELVITPKRNITK